MNPRLQSSLLPLVFLTVGLSRSRARATVLEVERQRPGGRASSARVASGCLGDEYRQQAVTVLRGQLEWRPTTVRLGGEGAGLAAALQQTPDPGGGDAEEVGDLLAGATALVAGTDATRSRKSWE